MSGWVCVLDENVIMGGETYSCAEEVVGRASVAEAHSDRGDDSKSRRKKKEEQARVSE